MPDGTPAPPTAPARSHSPQRRARRPGLLPALAAALLLTGCATTPERAEPPAPTASDRLSMTRGPCFGSCPMYTVTVGGDGRVRFVGERFVEQSGEHTATVDSVVVARLFAHLDSIGFFELPAEITPANEAACGVAWTDMPSADITITWADRHHAVRHYHGCPKAPDWLSALEDHIDDVLGVPQWVGRRE